MEAGRPRSEHECHVVDFLMSIKNMDVTWIITLGSSGCCKIDHGYEKSSQGER